MQIVICFLGILPKVNQRTSCRCLYCSFKGAWKPDRDNNDCLFQTQSLREQNSPPVTKKHNEKPFLFCSQSEHQQMCLYREANAELKFTGTVLSFFLSGKGIFKTELTQKIIEPIKYAKINPTFLSFSLFSFSNIILILSTLLAKANLG